jgi:hypothetical protein
MLPWPAARLQASLQPRNELLTTHLVAESLPTSLERFSTSWNACLSLATRAVIITDLVEELEEAEDDLDLAEAYVSRISGAPTLDDIMPADPQPGQQDQGSK